ncbi:MAG: hypothetical protein IJW98_06150 [Clostridia bacterium]|nr:hypothetical protein [Clostridia bacterium]
MRITKTIVPLLLLLGMLISCNSGKGGVTTTTNAPEKGDDDKKNPIALTQQMTPTPVLPADKIPMGDNKPRPPVPSGPDTPQGNPSEQGDGAELEGYYQLLKYINRDSVSGPAAWGRHVALDMLDGLFESTDEGSNKYGQDINNMKVYWEMTRPVTVNAYALYTANDTVEYPGRNPKDWTLFGSVDGEDWKVVHSVQDAELPVANYTGTVFEFDNDQAYRYYCWSLDAVVSGNAFQLSELLLYTTEEITEPVEGVGTFYGKLPTDKLTENGKNAEPLVSGDARFWMSAYNNLADKVKIDSAFINVQCWDENEGPDRLFDGIYTREDFESNNGGKLGAGMDSACIVWQMTEAVAPVGYVLVTGNDTSEYPIRNPGAWVLYGSNDGKTWEALDIVADSNMLGEDFAPHVYTLDDCGSYTWFCLSIEKAYGAMQLCELMLYN